MKCSDCPYYWCDADKGYSYCHYYWNDECAPCEVDGPKEIEDYYD